MGARTSRRQMTEAPRVTLEALPPELLVQMLSYLPPRALVTRCRPLCLVKDGFSKTPQVEVYWRV